jgi:hypothetical protein
MATHLDRISPFERTSGHRMAAHHLRLGMMGGLAVFWAVVAVSLWAVFS